MLYNFFSKISNLLSEPFLNIAFGIENLPLLTAFVLGLVGALAPCQFTGNIGAIAIYGNHSFQKKIAWKEVFYFTTGKILVFSILGLIVWLLGQEFQRSLTTYFPWIRKILGPLLILVGLFMLGVFKLNWNTALVKVPKKFKSGRFGAFFMGVAFSLGFCPTMFVLFFGSLMPIVLSTSYGAVLPSIFAFGTSIPLILAIFLIWYFEMDRRDINQKGRKLGVTIQKVTGGLMIVLGILDTITYWTY